MCAMNLLIQRIFKHAFTLLTKTFISYKTRDYGKLRYHCYNIGGSTNEVCWEKTREIFGKYKANN